MKNLFSKTNPLVRRWSAIAMSAAIVWVVLGLGATSAEAQKPVQVASVPQAAPAANCFDSQCFTDVPSSNPFFSFINSLFIDNIVSGHPCGGTGQPCDPLNRPYYLPGENVNRAEMAKFVDNGRKNISTAVGVSLSLTNTNSTGALVISSTNGDAVQVYTEGNFHNGIYVQCQRPSSNCAAFYSQVPAGDTAGEFTGGHGVFASSSDINFGAVRGRASGGTATSYGGDFASDQGSSLHVQSAPAQYERSAVIVDGVNGSQIAEQINTGALYVGGNLLVTGSKTGYVVDIMQNVDSTHLETGDVVVIAGSGEPVIGNIPVVTVKKASAADQSGVVGVVDQPLYVPDAATRKAYADQQKAVNEALQARDKAEEDAAKTGATLDYSKYPVPEASITDADGLPHAIDGTQVAPGSYANVVTLGSYQSIKVDASYGAIHAGDLLTTSPHAGYAMKVSDPSKAFGAVIGKALADLDSGIGTVPVMVTLK